MVSKLIKTIKPRSSEGAEARGSVEPRSSRPPWASSHSDSPEGRVVEARGIKHGIKKSAEGVYECDT